MTFAGLIESSAPKRLNGNSEAHKGMDLNHDKGKDGKATTEKMQDTSMNGHEAKPTANLNGGGYHGQNGIKNGIADKGKKGLDSNQEADTPCDPFG